MGGDSPGRGLPWWGAVLLPLGLTGLGAVVDTQVNHEFGLIFQGAYLVGCVVAVWWVRRRSLFGPMVQPPLILAAVAGSAVLLLPSSSHGDGWLSRLITVGTPLVDNFWILVVTSVVTLAIGTARLVLKGRQQCPTGFPN